jgi:hypothetical protein
MSHRLRMQLLGAIMLLAGLSFFQNCSRLGASATMGSAEIKGQGGSVTGTSTDNPMGGTSTDNPMKSSLNLSLAQGSSTTQVSFCINGSVFGNSTIITTSAVSASPFANSDAAFDNAFPNDAAQWNEDFAQMANDMSNPFLLSSGSAGSSPFGQQVVTVGTYNQIVLNLTAGCGSRSSVQVTNSHGTFSTASSISMTFRGTVAVNPSVGNIILNIASQTAALSQVTDGSQIQGAIQSTIGQFTAE